MMSNVFVDDRAAQALDICLMVCVCGYVWVGRCWGACVRYAGDLGFRAFFGVLQSVTGYLRLALVFVWNSAPWEGFNRYFLGHFC